MMMTIVIMIIMNPIIVLPSSLVVDHYHFDSDYKNQKFHSFTMMTIVIMIIMNTIIVKSIINLMTTLSSQPLVPVLLRLRSPSMRSTVWPWERKCGVEQWKACFVYFGQSLIDDQKLISQKSKDQSKNISGQSST